MSGGDLHIGFYILGLLLCCGFFALGLTLLSEHPFFGLPCFLLGIAFGLTSGFAAIGEGPFGWVCWVLGC